MTVDTPGPNLSLAEWERIRGVTAAASPATIGSPTFDRVKDSGARQEFVTGSVRDTSAGKGWFDGIPGEFEFRLARHIENGGKKYGKRNWEKGQPLSRYIDSAKRHLACLMLGMTDEDHAAAVAWNIMAWITTSERIAKGKLPAELDDMPK